MEVDSALARRLVDDRFPHLADLPILAVEQQGWDNRTFRLGAQLKLRFPRAAAYAEQVRKEARWLPFLAKRLHVDIPQVIAVGPPADIYPFDWSLQSWIDGVPVGASKARDPLFANDVARFLTALREIDASQGPSAGTHSFHRGGSLLVYDADMRTALDSLHGEIAVVAALDIWRKALDSRWEAAPVWVHGDMAAGNMLADAEDGQLCGVIDFGCMAIGDPACDLTVAWTLFEGEAREAFCQTIALDEATWARARGWALWKAMITLATDREDAVARQVIEALLG